ncbi:N-acetyl-gamma-glutamyl-phosphate reductase [Rothia sp. LK2588]|uniref:N-acetyl-gamma-glutamyl-phosphate reductase n=1 Tax=Rothia sp. LK2588 TaxID=3114369 RepID=UPI0034CE803C
MTLSIAVSGATGYAGGEVLRLLAIHPEVRVDTVTAHSSAGMRMGQLAPHLASVAELTVEETTVENLSRADVVFLALPHGASAEVAAQLPESTLVIDAGADHRLDQSRDWSRFYDTEYAGHWPYGLPELILADGTKQRERLRNTRRIAVPGCYPTASILALAPGMQAGLLDPEDVVIVAASGTSGAGKALKPHLLASEAMGSMSPYGVGGVHRHTPEIEQGIRWATEREAQVSFTPTLAPMPRGILATCTAHVAPGVGIEELREAYEGAYGQERYVRMLPEGQWPTTQSVLGSNHAHLQLALDQRSRRAIITAAIDNLAKGTAGGAIQSMNIALGLPEDLGLAQEGLAP